MPVGRVERYALSVLLERKKEKKKFEAAEFLSAATSNSVVRRYVRADSDGTLHQRFMKRRTGEERRELQGTW